MILKSLLVTTTILWVGIFTNPKFLYAQITNTSPLTKKIKDKELQTSKVLVVVFKDGVPTANIEVQTPIGVQKTNSEGLISFIYTTKKSLNIKELDFKILNTNQKFKVKILPGEESQAIVNYNSDVIVDVPTPIEIVKNENDLAAINEFKAQQKAKQKIKNSKEKNQLEDVVVLAPKIKGGLSALVEVRKQSSAVTDVLGSEQMTRAGDSDAASSLRRVTGLTLVGGKYVYVRGLGERYSGVQMNAFSLPSPEPSRRVVPLDLFPTAIMESVIVQKSYSPDLPGEFGGGIIQLQTKSLPENFFFRSSISTLYENRENALTSVGGSLDWLGIDDGTRAMPTVIQNAIKQGKALEVNTVGYNGGVSEQELTDMSRSLSNNYNLTNPQSQQMPGLAISAGNGWKFNSTKVGTSSSFMYGPSANQVTRLSRSLVVNNGNSLTEDNRRVTEDTEIETRLAGSLDFGVAIAKKHKIIANTFILRNTTNLAQTGCSEFVSGNPIDNLTMDFVECELWTKHLKGEYELGHRANAPIILDWRWGGADATRSSLDRREISYDVSGIDKSLLNDSTRRSFSQLADISQERAVNLTYPIQKNIKVKVGLLTLDKQRDSEMNRFMFSNKNSAATYDSASEAYAPENMGPDGFLLNNISANSTQADNYSGQQSIHAQYAMVDYAPGDAWSFQAGARHETSTQNVRTFNYTNPNVDSSLSRIEMNDILPSYGVVWKPNSAIRGRLAYSETLARPDFREMTPVGFTDDETGYIVSGNPNLKGTVIKNIDHRWEYYFTTDEYASVGFFYKKFENPIEAVFLSGPNRIQSFRNALAANNYGIEFEGRMGARHISRYFRRWTLLSNVSFIKSQIEISPDSASSQTSSSRPLQGQSPYVLNLQIQYDRPVLGFTATLLYNMIGERITEVGVNGIPDIYEQPFGQLDLVASHKLKPNWTLSFRARNLLDPAIEATQNSEVVRSMRRGRAFGVTVGGVF
jgi:outer membrane receptor protein involved in Fe transport